MYDPLGLSIGTVNLVAARSGSPPVTRRTVLTLFPDRPPEIGVAAENSNRTEPGIVLRGFVERVGDAVPLVSADGSAYDADLLLVEALAAMVRAVGADLASSQVTIAVPAHWGPGAVGALRDRLRTHVGFASMPVRLVSDAVAALTALNSDPGLPGRGLVGLLDFGGGGTSVTVADAGSGFAPITETFRYPEFSGDEIDLAVLAYVLQDIGHIGNADPDSTAAAADLGQLREQCRQAKEQLSTQTAAELVAELPGHRASVRLTRAELETLIQDQLGRFLHAFEDMLARNDIGWEDLAAVATVGGGANIPLIAERLSSHPRTPVLGASHPAFTMAIGAMLFPSDGPLVDVATPATTVVPTAGATTVLAGLPAGADEPGSSTVGELAWSQDEDTGDQPAPHTGEFYSEDGARPPRNLPEIGWGRFRLPQLIFGLCALVAIIAIGGVAYTLTSKTDREAPTAPSGTTVPAPLPSSVAPSPIPPPPSVAPSPSEVPAPSSSEPPPPPPSTTTTHRPPTTTTTTPPPTTTTTPPPTTTTAPATTIPTTTVPAETTVPMTTEWLTVPLLPVPIPVPVPANPAGPD